MQANTVEDLALFERDIRYIIPLFQRNYDWHETEHWEPFWQDVRAVADHILVCGEHDDLAPLVMGAIAAGNRTDWSPSTAACGTSLGLRRAERTRGHLAGTWIVRH